MKLSGVARYFVWGACVAVALTASAQPLVREANTSHRLPLSLPAKDYELELAFPEIRSFSQPVAIVSPPGETNRLFILERPGRIRVIPDLENPERRTFLSLTRSVESSSGEQGILGLAFHPNYQENGTFFVFYTARGEGDPNRLSRFQVNPENPNEGLAESEVILFSQRDDAGNHNGGDLHFGPDGYLYVALGDEGAANDSLRNSQRLDRDFFAGILRIDVDKRLGNLEPNPHPAIALNDDGRANYSVPADNPFVGFEEFNGDRLIPRAVRTEFWAVGLRNPWRMAFDPITGELYVGDVGQNRREEVNIIEKGGNYGWNYREGSIAGPERSGVPEGVTFLDPILEYSRGSQSNQGNSITGGVVYRGSRISALYGNYVFADYASGNIWRMWRDADGTVDWENIGREAGISAFGTDPRNGDVLIADFNSSRIWRLVASGSDLPTEAGLPETLADTGLFTDLESLEPQPGIVPYTINAPFWSDGAEKRRWFSVPDVEKTIGFSTNGNWGFPEGMFWVKHFDLEMRSGDPDSKRRLETRIIMKGEQGIYGATYRWDDSQENASLVPEEGMNEVFLIEDEGGIRRQVWRYPSRSECLQCHTREGGEALGFNTAQLNRVFDFSGGSERIVSQVTAYHEAGYFGSEANLETELPQLASIDDPLSAIEDRVRSYLDVNCSQCHQPGGASIGRWDARAEVAFSASGIVSGELANPSVQPGRRVVVPGEPQSSELFLRMASLGSDRMPPLGSNRVDEQGLDLIRSWIGQSMVRGGYEMWAERFFGSALDPRSEVNLDVDGDGYNNRLEYRLGTDPTNANDRWEMSVVRTALGIEIHFPAVIDPSLEVRLVEAMSLDEDSAWQNVEGTEQFQFHGLGGESRSIQIPSDQADERYFRAVFEEQ